MKKIHSYIILLILGFVFQLPANAQTGIGTNNPHSSAILEVDVSSLPNNGKKGFLGPKVALTSITDQVTTGTPALGLLVYNTANAGLEPTNVIADRYYFWNGTEWISLIGREFINEALIQKMFYSTSTTTQTFTQANLNVAGTGNNNLVNFDAVSINTGNIVTLSGNLFTINKAGQYEISAFVNYNPNGVPETNGTFKDDRKLLNLKVQLSVSGAAGPWVDIAGSRSIWSIGTSLFHKTVSIGPTVYRLAQGNILRVVIQNPGFIALASPHGNGTIATSNNVPVARALRLHLLDYNL